MRRLINDQLARELQLDRPPTSLAERVFRICICIVIVLGVIGAALRLVFSEDRVEKTFGASASVAGVMFVVCFLYVLNYATWRYCPTRWIRWTWFALEASFILALLIALWITNGRTL